MFIGMTFTSSPTSMIGKTVVKSPVEKLTLSNSKPDELYISENVLNPDFDWTLPNNWDYQVDFHSYFTDGNTMGGNALFNNELISEIMLKKRYKGDFAWKTFYLQTFDHGADSIDALNITYWDSIEPTNREIEYAYVAIMDNNETEPITVTVESKFTNDFIVGRDNVIYSVLFDIDNQVNYNRNSNVIVSPGRKYPYIVTNGISRYYSGTLQATYIPIVNCELDLDNAWKYRKQIDEFLCDGNTKILKTKDGDLYMVAMYGGVSRSNGSDPRHISQSFEWAEVGNPNDIGDLYDNGFIQTDIDRSGVG